MIFVIVNKFSKQGYFIVDIKEILAENIAQIYIQEVFVKYGTLDKIILDKDVRFIAAFQKIFIAEQKIKAVTLTAYHPQIDG